MVSVRLIVAAGAAMVLGTACGGRSIGRVDAGVAAAGSSGAAGATGAAGTMGVGEDAGGDADAGVIQEPGFVGWRRLTLREYDNTILELLGVEGRARQTFGYESPWYARNDVISTPYYERYFEEAERVAEATFANAAARDRVAACPGATPGTEECLRVAIAKVAQRAWRRPLSGAESDSLMALARTALGEGRSLDGALQRVLAGLLSSASFLFRVELDPSPTSLAPHALTPWELASRLSYLAWSTMPDARLFALAADGSLAREDVLAAELDRLLADQRADALVDEFVLAWLMYGSNIVLQHLVEPTSAPSWTPTLAAAMTDEARLYIGEFLRGDRSFATFPEADFNFVNAELAQHYGFPTTGLGADLKRVEVTSDRRQGFLGLGMFLTGTSYSYRTSPTLRGKLILQSFLCEEVPPPPADIPRLDPAPEPVPQSLRERLEAHVKDKACSYCHVLMDPMGLGLEEFDHVGRYRKTYSDGTLIDASGGVPEHAKIDPNGPAPPLKPFVGEPELTRLLARDQRFLDCASRQALSYALGKVLGEDEMPGLKRIRASWAQQGSTLRGLIKRVVLDDTFRTRRAEGTP